jgi:ubiquinone biosynthesis protein Coq4
MSHHHSDNDSVFSFITGLVIQVIGMITLETFWVPLLLAFAGGFLGLIGKKLAEAALKRIQRVIFPGKKRSSHHQ